MRSVPLLFTVTLLTTAVACQKSSSSSSSTGGATTSSSSSTGGATSWVAASSQGASSAAASASSQGASSTGSSSAASSGGAVACGTVTVTGECDGNILRWCAAVPDAGTQLVSRDCATRYPGSPGTCVHINDSWGFDCQVPTGSKCSYVTAGGRQVIAFCDGIGGGCVQDLFPPDGGTVSQCTTNLGDCVPATPDAGFAQACQDATRLKVTCNVNQPFVLRCPPGDTCTNNRCEGPEGAPCADDAQGVIIGCAAGLHCGSDAGRVGTCRP